MISQRIGLQFACCTGASLADQSQRRRTSRFPVRRPVSATADGKELVGITRDVNAEGVFFFTEMPVPEGSHVDIFLTLPPGSIFSDQVAVRASGTAVRVERNEADGTLGVAVAFEQIEIDHSMGAAGGAAKQSK